MDMHKTLIDTSMDMECDDEASDDEEGAEEDTATKLVFMSVMERGHRSVTRRSTATPHGVEKWDFQSTCDVLCCAVLCCAALSTHVDRSKHTVHQSTQNRFFFSYCWVVLSAGVFVVAA
jgi:hypothetical protein